MKILISGAASFIGYRIAQQLGQENRHQVFGIGRTKEILPAYKQVFVGDITSDLLAECFFSIGFPDVIINCASPASAYAVPNPNDMPLLVIANLCNRLSKPSRPAIVHLSSCAVYGDVGWCEVDQPLAPISPYGRFKEEEEFVFRQSGLHGLNVRGFSTYGPRNRKQLFWEVLTRQLSCADGVLNLSGTGEEIRDYIHVDDFARMVCSAIPLIEDGVIQTFNVGTGIGHKIADVVGMLLESTGTNAYFNSIPRSYDPQSLVADISFVRQTLKIHPVWTLQNGIAQYKQWFDWQRKTKEHVV